MRLPVDSLIFRVVSIGTILIIAAVAIFSQPNNENCSNSKNRSSEEIHHCKLEADFRETLEKDPTAYFTKWLVIFTGVLSIVSIVQIGFLIRADGTARKSADAAKASADALQAAERATIIEHIYSAYGAENLFSSGLLFNNSPSMNDTGPYPVNFSVLLKIRNYGKTPATIFSYSVEPMISEFPPEFDFIALKKVNYKVQKLLNPVIEAQGATETIQIARVIQHTWAQSNLLVAHKLNLWLVGYITFSDVFDVVSTREFRWLYDLPMQAFTPGHATTTIDQHPKNNS